MRRRDALLAVAAFFVAAILIVASAGSRGARTSTNRAPTAVSGAATSADPFAAFALAGPAIDWSRPTPTGTVTAEGYVGSEVCAKCHGDVAKRYAARPMANTGMHRLASRTLELDAIFDGTHVVQHAASGFSYRPMHDDEGYFVEERIDAPDGRPLHVRREPVTLSFTAGASGAAFGFERGGRLHQVPIDWYAESATWGLDPGYVQNGRFSRPFGVSCIGCHTEYPRHVPANEAIVVGPLSTGIGCERCHGPGARHASSTSAEDVVNPARLSFARQLDVCAQCHLEGTAEVLRDGQGHYGYAAGTPLSQHQVQWVEERPSVDWFALVGASDRLVRSACFQKAPGKLGCTSCHDAHGGKPAQPVRAVCAGCHTASSDVKCTAPASERAAKADECASCHMARDTPSDFRQRVPGVRLQTVDHWIRRRPQVARALDAAPLAQPVGAIVPWLRLVEGGRPAAIGDVELMTNEVIARISSGSGLVNAPQPLLLSIAKAPPPSAALYRTIGDAYGATVEAGSATTEEQRRLSARLRDARAMEVRLAPDDVEVLARYAQACLLVGDADALREAESALRRSLAIAPEDSAALTELGGLLFRRGRTDEALPILGRAIAVGTDVLEAHVLLAVLACEKGDVRAAVRHFEDARRDAPRDRWILEQLANLYTGLGDAAASEEIAHALKFVPPNSRRPEFRRSTRWLSPLR